MSEEQKGTPEHNNADGQRNAADEARKKQFEKMKERFGKQNSPLGNRNNNSGNNFYWVYGIIIAVLLFFVFYGNDFKGKIYIFLFQEIFGFIFVL